MTSVCESVGATAQASRAAKDLRRLLGGAALPPAAQGIVAEATLHGSSAVVITAGILSTTPTAGNSTQAKSVPPGLQKPALSADAPAFQPGLYGAFEPGLPAFISAREPEAEAEAREAREAPDAGRSAAKAAVPGKAASDDGTASTATPRTWPGTPSQALEVEVLEVLEVELKAPLKVPLPAPLKALAGPYGAAAPGRPAWQGIGLGPAWAR